MTLCFELFLSFFIVGAISFGGGYGMLALMQDQVLSRGWMTEEEFLNFVAVAESTPGPIAVNMATFVGSNVAGILGSFFATFGVVLPAFLIILIIASLLKNLMQYPATRAVLSGLRPTVVGLIFATSAISFASAVFAYKNVGDRVSFDFTSLLLFLLLAVFATVWKKIKKKQPSPIVLILASAVFGIVFMR